MRRDLLPIRLTDVAQAKAPVLGFVELDATGRRRIEGSALTSLASMRADIGDKATVDEVLTNGWSNGALFFGEPA